jgi:CRISPR system Cascade subunit CasE
MMYFSKAELSRHALGRDQNWELSTNGYRSHQLVWSLFSDTDERDRDFIFRWETDGRLPVLYTVSEREPVDREGYFGRLGTKKYAPKLVEGQPLAFSLRANSVVKKRDEDGRQTVHDVVMNAKHELRQADEWEDCELTQAELVQREGLEWLSSRSKQYGYELDPGAVSAEGHQRHEFRKAGNGRRVVISTIDFRGRLRVANPARFSAALVNGVGPSKAFGCGLMLVRPI